MSCAHEDFEAHVDVGRISADEEALERDEIKAFRATITVKCTQCGCAFGFRTGGVVGDFNDRPACSPDALELRVPLISPNELELLGPLAAMRTADGLIGYQVRTR